MDDFSVGDRRRFIGVSDSEHEVRRIAHWAVQVRYDDGRTVVFERPHYDGISEPVPAAPTFERADVVLNRSSPHTPMVVTWRGDVVHCLGPSGVTVSHHPEKLVHTRHKVATVDEDSWYTITPKGYMVLWGPRERAEEGVRLSSVGSRAIATVRDGCIVEPYVDDDGVEHLVPVLSEARS